MVTQVHIADKEGYIGCDQLEVIFLAHEYGLEQLMWSSMMPLFTPATVK